MPDLTLKNVCYRYPKSKYNVLNGIDATFREGTVTSVRGQSGAGKSTLLYLIAGLEKPVNGEISWNGAKVTDLTLYRRNIVSLISQSYLLFSARTAIENVCYPLQMKGESLAESREEAARLLNSVGIFAELFNRLPNKLSGGEQQRTAIARCLAAHSSLIAADEPTGNLDEENTGIIMKILLNLAHEHGKTVIIVTHDTNVAERADFRLKLLDGRLEAENQFV